MSRTTPFGGSAVVHRPGVLNISLIQAALRSPSISSAYGELTGLLARALRRLGLETCAGPAMGACCDGAHNLLWRGRKLAGAAAVIRRREEGTARLVHARLVVSGDLRRDLRLVGIAERSWSGSRAYRPEAHAGVSEALALQAGTCRSRPRGPPP